MARIVDTSTMLIHVYLFNLPRMVQGMKSIRQC